MRVLTKSRFKLGLECPNKLYYTNKKDEYSNIKSDNPFLQALASGGFQVEELARLHYSQGILIEDAKDATSYDYQEKVAQTNELLKKDDVVIFEAAFLYENLFIRVDILEKKGNQINLIEVKAKSFKKDSKDDINFTKWKFYLFDVAFQKFVIEKAHPDFKVIPNLMIANKEKTTSINGLNQLFRISKNTNNRTGIEKKISELNNIDEESILTIVNIQNFINRIELSELRILPEYKFEDTIELFATSYQDNRYFNYETPLQICKKCEFKSDESKPHLKSGFNECMIKRLNYLEEDLQKPLIYDIWDFRSWKKINELHKLKLVELGDDVFGNEKTTEGIFSRVQRQIVQKTEALKDENERGIVVLKETLKKEMRSWVFPLNFIDFEASTVALPFYAGQKPYEKVVFQFSHHIYYEDGRIEHANEFINVEAGKFPNFDFIRQLKKALSQNDGDVFQYSPYENSTLNQIKLQLQNSNEEDKKDLIDFIKTITTPPSSNDYAGEVWKPSRKLIDLRKIIIDYYYNPLCKGSNSIKDILPAIFKSSQLIRGKYTNPINTILLTSKNFNPNHIWLTFENDIAIDPYKKLEPPFREWNEDFERLCDIEEINNGGAALTAYGLAQYTDMSNKERNKIKNALLKYCELDTLAMVMVYEHLREVCEMN